MKLVIKRNDDEVGEWVAKYVRDKIHAHQPTSERPFVLGLPTGSSPLPMYKCLVKMYREGDLSFRYVKTFNMDEYVGLDADHPASYHQFMWEKLFKYIDIDAKNANILDGKLCVCVCVRACVRVCVQCFLFCFWQYLIR